MDITVKDYREAGNYLSEFFNNRSETFCMINMDYEKDINGYTFVKLPYTENINFLYGTKAYKHVLTSQFDLRYMGFYHLGSKQAYITQEHSECFLKFEYNFICENTLKTMLIKEIQQAVAERIVNHEEEVFKDILVTVADSDITGDAEKAFSKKETLLDFAKKITINPWTVSHSDLINFIDNPQIFLPEKAESRIRGSREELARLWKAHCTAQKLLDLMNAGSFGGNDYEGLKKDCG